MTLSAVYSVAVTIILLKVRRYYDKVNLYTAHLMVNTRKRLEELNNKNKRNKEELNRVYKLLQERSQ